MELRHLRYFVAVAEQLNFTKAAAKLRLAQPSLTRQIKNLEEELRVQLFARDTRNVALTDQGRFFLERARRLLAQSAQDVQDVQRRGLLSGRHSLNIGYTADLHHNLLPSALEALRDLWPDVALNLFDLTLTEQLQAFDRNKLDLSFVCEPKLPTKTSLRHEPIHDCEVMAVVPEAFPQAHAPLVELAELGPLPFVVLSGERHPGLGEWVQRVCKRAGFAPQITHAVDRVPTMLNCVGLELGVALLPRACQKLAHGGVAFRPLAEAVKSRMEVMWKRPSLSRPLGQYVELIRTRLG